MIGMVKKRKVSKYKVELRLKVDYIRDSLIDNRMDQGVKIRKRKKRRKLSIIKLC
jgi:hypothetical protein